MNPAHRELKSGAARSRLRLALGLSSFSSSGHDEIVVDKVDT